MSYADEQNKINEVFNLILAERERLHAAEQLLSDIRSGRYRYYAQLDDKGREVPDFYEMIDRLLGSEHEGEE